MISAVTLPDGYNTNIRAGAIPFGEVDSTSTSEAYTATVPGISALVDGVCVLLKNGVVTSESGFTININGLGAKPSYSNMATGHGDTNPTRDTTIFNINYTMLFVYSEDIVSGGGWICYRGYDANTNTIGYQLRTNSSSLPVSGATYRYRLLFTSANGTHFVPANTSTSTNATASRTVNQTPIDPFGRIVYYSHTSAVSSGSRPGATYLWEQYAISLGYSFNRTGAALTLTSWRPVYIKCAPQADGSAIMDSTTPYVQALPSTDDGKIYIFLGIAYSATNIELVPQHPVYYYKDGAIRQWTNSAAGSSLDVQVNGTSIVSNDVANIVTNTAYNSSTNKIATMSDIPTVPTKTSDLTNDSGFITGITSSDVTSALGYTPLGQLYVGTTAYNILSVSKANFQGISGITILYDNNGDTDYIFIPDGDGFNTGTQQILTTVAQTYATKQEIPTLTSELTNDSGFITSETDPTVPAWAKASTKPTYTASEVGALATTGGQITGDLTLYTPSGNSPGVIFQRGTLTDNYNDWKIYDKGGYLYFAQRGSGSSSFNDMGYISTTGVLTNFTIPWGSVTGKPAQLPTVTTSDNGKVLRVVNGAWSAVELPSASGVSF